MLQQVMTNPGEIIFREVPVPEVKENQVLVKPKLLSLSAKYLDSLCLENSFQCSTVENFKDTFLAAHILKLLLHVIYLRENQMYCCLMSLTNRILFFIALFISCSMKVYLRTRITSFHFTIQLSFAHPTT